MCAKAAGSLRGELATRLLTVAGGAMEHLLCSLCRHFGGDFRRGILQKIKIVIFLLSLPRSLGLDKS